ncbi:hypothetical protein IFDJLNFL_5469 [Methylobacterium dankookense]|uniref:Uncharacterized protein n=1 Tax=Methylobacterium dankookense TaxID=560405 RepID=A0ABQ4RQS7_9HYPH|nr:hypothetical protein IFDJLNFL_5469 [Methylobacterium dankookense]
MAHIIAPDLARPVGEAEIEQEPRRLDGARAEIDRAAALPPVEAAAAVDHGRDAARAIPLQPVHHALRPDLGAVAHGVGQVGHVHAGLGAGAAALVAIAASDAGRAGRTVLLLEIPRDHRRGRVGGADPEPGAGGRHDLGRAVARHRGQGVAAAGIPRIVRRARDADEALHALVEGQQVVEGQRPVATLAGLGAEREVAPAGARHEGAPVQGRAADPRAAVVGAERFGGRAAAEALLRPVDLVGERLVEGEGGGREIRPGLQRHDREARRGEPGEDGRAARARADHHRVHDRVLGVGPLPVESHRTGSRAFGSQGSGGPEARAKPGRPLASPSASVSPTPPAPIPEKPIRASAMGWAR